MDLNFEHTKGVHSKESEREIKGVSVSNTPCLDRQTEDKGYLRRAARRKFNDLRSHLIASPNAHCLNPILNSNACHILACAFESVLI